MVTNTFTIAPIQLRAIREKLIRKISESTRKNFKSQRLRDTAKVLRAEHRVLKTKSSHISGTATYKAVQTKRRPARVGPGTTAV